MAPLQSNSPNAATAKVLVLLIGKARQVESTDSGEWWDKPWQTGFYKESQSGPCWLGYEGFRSDEQADRRYHGGPEKAVCAYPAEHYPYWRETLGLPELPHGAFGENLTLEGLPESEACIGDRFSLGGAEVQVSQPRQPCWKLARRWQVKDLAARAERNGFTGYYFRVLRHGRFAVTKTESDSYVFRAAPLRNVALTAPYFHSGQVWSASHRAGWSS